jgi:hypothetical protein
MTIYFLFTIFLLNLFSRPAKLSDIRSKNLAANYEVDFVASETNARTCNYVNYNNGGTPHPNKRGI